MPSALYLGRRYVQTKNAINHINHHFALCTDVLAIRKVMFLIAFTLGYQFNELGFRRVLNYTGKMAFMLQWNWKAGEKCKIYTRSTAKIILHSLIKLILPQYNRLLSGG